MSQRHSLGTPVLNMQIFVTQLRTTDVVLNLTGIYSGKVKKRTKRRKRYSTGKVGCSW